MTTHEYAVHFLTGAAGFAVITSLTWFFAGRRDLFVMIFGMGRPEADRSIPYGEAYSKPMRIIASLQAIATFVIALFGVILWLIA